MFLVINVLRSKRREFLYVWHFARGASEIYVLPNKIYVFQSDYFLINLAKIKTFKVEEKIFGFFVYISKIFIDRIHETTNFWSCKICTLVCKLWFSCANLRFCAQTRILSFIFFIFPICRRFWQSFWIFSRSRGKYRYSDNDYRT